MRLIIIAVLIISLPCSADEINISENEVLSYFVPEEFDFQISQNPDSGIRPALDFAHFNDQGVKDFGYKIFLNRVDPAVLNTDKEKEDYLNLNCLEHKASSVEQEVIIKKHPGDNDVFICSFTDKNIAADAEVPLGEFRNISIAFVKEGNYAYTTVVYSNETSGALFDKFLSTLYSLKVSEI